MKDLLSIGGVKLTSRLFVGTGKFADYKLIPLTLKAAKAQVITVALRRVDFETPEEKVIRATRAVVMLVKPDADFKETKSKRKGTAI